MSIRDDILNNFTREPPSVFSFLFAGESSNARIQLKNMVISSESAPEASDSDVEVGEKQRKRKKPSAVEKSKPRKAPRAGSSCGEASCVRGEFTVMFCSRGCTSTQYSLQCELVDCLFFLVIEHLRSGIKWHWRVHLVPFVPEYLVILKFEKVIGFQWCLCDGYIRTQIVLLQWLINTQGSLFVFQWETAEAS